MNVTIIGGLHHNTLGVLRSIGEKKIDKHCIDVILVGKKLPPRNIISASKYVEADRIIYVPSDENVIAQLKKLKKDHKKRVIICCSDGSSAMVIKHADELTDSFFIPSTKLDISELMSKEVQSQIAEECGMRIPSGKVEEVENLDDWNIFPCITKPIMSISGGGKADIRISRNRGELLAALQTTLSRSVQIQEYLQKSMEFQLIGCSLEGGRQIIIPGYTNILRQPDNTNTGYLEYSPIEGLNIDVKPLEKFINKIGYSGLFSMEFIRDVNGIDYFLEINMRNDGNAYCVQTAGVNLPYIWCYYQENGKLPNEKITFENSIRFIPDFIDMKRGIHEVGMIKWARQFMEAKSHTLYNKKDMGPFWLELGKYVKSFTSKLVKKKHLI